MALARSNARYTGGALTRTRRALSGAAILAVHGVIGAVTPFILSPLLLRLNGREAVGGFSIVLQIVSYAVLLDLGIGQALSRELAQTAYSAELVDRHDKAVISGAMLLSVVGVLAGIALYCVASTLAVWLKDDAGHLADLRAALLIYALWMPLRFTLTLGPTLLFARQAVASYAAIALGADIFRSVMMVVAVALGGGLRGIAVASVGSEALGLLIGVAIVARDLKSVQWQRGTDLRSVCELIRVGLPLALVTLGDRLTYYSQSIIVGGLYDTRASAAFYATRAPSNAGMTLIWRGLDSTAPGLNDLFVRGTPEALRSAYVRLAGYSVGVSLWFSAVIWSVNEKVVRAWLGSSLYLGATMTLAVCVLAPLATFKNVATKFVVVEGVVTRYGWILIFEGLVNIGLSWSLGRWIGPSGAMVATVVAHGVSVPYLMLRAAATTGMRPIALIRSTVWIAVRCASVGAVVAFVVATCTTQSVTSIVLTIGVSAIVGIPAFVFIGLNDGDRDSVLRLLPRWTARLPFA